MYSRSHFFVLWCLFTKVHLVVGADDTLLSGRNVSNIYKNFKPRPRFKEAVASIVAGEKFPLVEYLWIVLVYSRLAESWLEIVLLLCLRIHHKAKTTRVVSKGAINWPMCSLVCLWGYHLRSSQSVQNTAMPPSHVICLQHMASVI